LFTWAWYLYWCLLTGLLLYPKLPGPPLRLTRRGQVAHFVVFALLAAGRAWTVRRGDQGPGRLQIWWWVLAAYALATEGLQPAVGRHGDLWDVAANLLGIVAGAWLAWRWDPLARARG
jgi:hypothetical protein